MEERVKELSKYRFETSLENLEDSKIITQASINREKADYLDFYIASCEEAQKQIARAEEFSGAIKVYLTKQGILCDL